MLDNVLGLWGYILWNRIQKYPFHSKNLKLLHGLYEVFYFFKRHANIEFIYIVNAPILNPDYKMDTFHFK